MANSIKQFKGNDTVVSKNIIDLNLQKEYSEMYHADMFEMGLKYKVYTDILPYFENVLREIPCKEGIADFICYKQTNFLRKNSSIICEINKLVGKSFIPVISVLMRNDKQTIENISLLSGYNTKRLRKIIDILSDFNVLKENKLHQYSLYANWKNFDVDLWAFELKLKNWKRALYQATQYKAFSNNVFTIFPSYKKNLLEKNIHYFKNLNIGCILMNSDTNELMVLNYPKKEELVIGSQYLYALTETIINNSKAG